MQTPFEPAASVNPPPTEQAVLGEVLAALENLPAMLEIAAPALNKGFSLGELRGLGPETYAPLYHLACEMCDEGRFQDAMPVALALVGHEPADSQFCFLAGTCLQRCGRFAEAAWMYGIASLEGEPVSLYRMGECLAAHGKEDKAREAFGQAREACVGDAGSWSLHQLCTSALERLDRTGRNTDAARGAISK